MEISPSDAIDQSIKTSYHAICFNPEQKITLNRLSAPQSNSSYLTKSAPKSDRNPPQEYINNQLVNKYISYVYDKYKIEDPIEKEFRLLNKQEHQKQIFHKTPQKPSNKSILQSQKQTSTKDKLDKMRKSYKQDNSQILYTTQFHTQRNFRNSDVGRRISFKPSVPTKQIGYRTKQKIRFKTLTNEDQLQVSFSTTQRVNTSFNLDHPMSPPTVKQTQRTQRTEAYSRYMPQNQQVQASFRYCPMCEEIILEHNIASHQASCKQIQNAYNMPLEELEQLFIQKVERMKNQLQAQLRIDEAQKLRQHQKLNKTLSDWLSSEDDETFSNLKDEYHKVALDQYYLVTKLDWFKKLKQKIVQQREEKSKERIYFD